MKTLIAILLTASFFFGCSSIKESISTVTIHRDTVIVPQGINSIAYSDSADVEFQNWAYETIQRQGNLIDSLARVKGDTAILFVPVPLKPFTYSQSSPWTVTPNGDSVKVSFKKEANKKGEFTFNVKPAAIKVSINDTKTTEVKEYQMPWYQKLWNDFKDFILFGLIFILGIGLLIQKFKPKLF